MPKSPSERIWFEFRKKAPRADISMGFSTEAEFREQTTIIIQEIIKELDRMSKIYDKQSE